MTSAIISIVVGLLPVIVKGIEWFLDYSKATKEQKEAFFRWVKKAGEDYGSVKLLEKGEAQLKWLQENAFQETKA